MEYWSVGVVEWPSTPTLQYSITAFCLPTGGHKRRNRQTAFYVFLSVLPRAPATDHYTITKEITRQRHDAANHKRRRPHRHIGSRTDRSRSRPPSQGAWLREL